MGKIERFEEIRAWQMAKDLVAEIYCASGKGDFARDFALRDHIRRATITVMANNAEGIDRSSDKEFQRFLYKAKGSAGELRSHLVVARELAYITTDEFVALRVKAEEVF